jgi:hypothetical protein
VPIAGHNDIVGLDVSMYDSSAMRMPKGGCDIMGHHNDVITA